MHPKYIVLSLAGSAMSSLIPRQTDMAVLQECASKAVEFIGAMPTPGPELVKALTGAQPIDECRVSVPASLSSDYQKYMTSVASWANKGLSELSTCPGYEEKLSEVPTKCFSQMGITLGPKTTAAPSATGSTGSARTTTQSGLAPQGTTGLGLAAIAVAGLALAAL